MSYILAVIYTLTCFFLIRRMLVGHSNITAQLGVLALFSIGYYPLPVFFQTMTDLRDYDDQTISTALLIHFVFLVFLLFGVVSTAAFALKLRPLSFGPIDVIAARHRLPLSFISFALYILYILTVNRSSYSAQDFDAFFEDKSQINSIIAAFAGLFVAFIALSYASASASKNRRDRLFYLLMIGAIVFAAVPTAARLAIISPLLTVFCAIAITGEVRKAMRILGVAVLTLMIVSPFAVFLRESMHDEQGGLLSASEVANKYSISDDPFTQSFQSILNRSDLISVTIYMKKYIDATEYVGGEFYYSVIASPIPRFIYREKPPVLSSNGQLDGEISTLAYRLMNGGLGSLTAFGGLTAYRQGGWIAVILDGLAVGAFFVGVARWFGDGGWVARMFYVNFFVMFSVQKVPPSFFEALTSVLGQAPLILCLFIVSKALTIARLSKKPIRVRAAIGHSS